MSLVILGGCGVGSRDLYSIMSRHTGVISPLGEADHKFAIFQRGNRYWKEVQKMREKYADKKLIYHNPDNFLLTKKIRAIYPDCKMIWVHQDGRQVTQDLLKNGKKGGFLACVQHWTSRTKTILKYGGPEHHDRILLVRYEDLMKPEELARIQEFLGLEIEDLSIELESSSTSELDWDQEEIFQQIGGHLSKKLGYK